jgi:hypothetical protein
MHAVKRIVPVLLVLAVIAVVLVTLLSDHESEYGSVPLPAGGTVELPEGSVQVFFDEAGGGDEPELAAPLSFQVAPAGGGPPVELEATAKGSNSEVQFRRSEEISTQGSVAKLEIPEQGDYAVSGGQNAAAGSSLTFGTSPFGAVAERWQLLAGLLGAAVLIALIPLDRRRSSGADPAGWSSDPRPPYA